jgi:acetylornithine deacetylase/succinyl-diaminopimelate desuccinylase-like protein
VWLTAAHAAAQTLTVQQYADQVAALQQHAKTKQTAAFVDKMRAAILKEWIAITEINAPSGHEQERAAYVKKLLSKLKLSAIRTDAAGNLIAVRKGAGGGPAVVFDAHLDTVFQPGLKIKAVVKDGRIHAPGVGDDTRNIVALLATMRALNDANVKTKGDLIFVFTTREETGLDGAERFVADNKGKIDYYVALDGGYENFTYAGIGTNWYRHHFIGPGGHTRSRTPPYSATLPLARAIARIYELPVPENSQLNVGMLGGSEVINAKASDAWFSVDLRSTRNEVIADLEKRVAAILQEEAARESMAVKTEVISASPAAVIPGHRDFPLVRMTEAVWRAYGSTREPTPTASNNASAALRAGISAISTGCGPCEDSHSLTESCEIEPLYNGIKRNILLALVLAQMAE